MRIVQTRRPASHRLIPVIEHPHQPVGKPMQIRRWGRLVRAGRQYVDRRGWQGPWRIDILAVTVGSDGSAAVERFEDVTAGAYFS